MGRTEHEFRNCIGVIDMRETGMAEAKIFILVTVLCVATVGGVMATDVSDAVVVDQGALGVRIDEGFSSSVPLVVLDGVPIEDMTVLKDASSTSIYGSCGVGMNDVPGSGQSIRIR